MVTGGRRGPLGVGEENRALREHSDDLAESDGGTQRPLA